MFKRFLLGTAGVMVAASMASTGANALIIDDFSDPLENVCVGAACGDGTDDGSVEDNTDNGSAIFDRSVQVSGTILGGDRELLVSKTSGGSDTVLKVSAAIAGGLFTHSNPATISGTSLLRWDGTAGDTDGLDFNLGGAGAGVDLTQGGTLHHIHISVVSADLTGSTVHLRLYTDAGNMSELDTNLPSGASEHFISLAAIAAIDTLGTGVDLTVVRAIELVAVGGPNFDVAMDIIEVVPEPASLTLLGAGVMGLGAIKRRRKAA